MIKSLLWPAFILLVLAQWWVPGQMIWRKEKVLSDGKPYKFQSAPIDPADPFRGRYIILNFKENEFKVAGKSKLLSGSKVFVSYFADKNGFAKISAVDEVRPPGSDYLETTVSFTSSENDTTSIFLNYGFSNYYMEEFKAPQAEAIYNETVANRRERTYALVNLLNGDAVIKNVYINDTLLQDVMGSRKILR